MSDPAAELARLIESANRLGVEIDEAEALSWLSAMAGTDSTVADGELPLDAMGLPGGDITQDASGAFGHRITMLDFSAADLAHFRAIGSVVEIPDRPGVIETALALSGSAAQSKIQTHPGDCDYFERMNILADTRAEATALLAEVIREKILSTLRGSTHQFTGARFGGFPVAGIVGEREVVAGASVQWTPAQVVEGAVQYVDLTGATVTLTWLAAAADPGWVKLDWIVAHPASGGLAYATNVIDVTWESPAGEITPLDGQLDPYFQEVYLDAAAIPIFSKLARNVAGDALDSYVDALTDQVRMYLAPDHLNYGKVAKRLYNIFRLTGRYSNAAYLRELFDESGAVLYQIAALIDTVAEAQALRFERERIGRQLDEIVLAAVIALDGQQEVDVVASLLGLRAALLEEAPDRPERVAAASTVVMGLVNDFFERSLNAVDAIADYLTAVAPRP